MRLDIEPPLRAGERSIDRLLLRQQKPAIYSTPVSWSAKSCELGRALGNSVTLKKKKKQINIKQTRKAREREREERTIDNGITEKQNARGRVRSPSHSLSLSLLLNRNLICEKQ